MGKKLDSKDRRIIYELDKNSRQSFTELGAKTRISKESIRYRVNSLIESGVIKGFLAIPDTHKLGYIHYKIFYKLQNLNLKKEQEIINYLKNNPHIHIIYSMDGIYDLCICVIANNLFQLDEITTNFKNKYSHYIGDKQVTTILKGQYSFRDYLIEGKPTPLRKYSLQLKTSLVEIDDLDWRILGHLTGDARATTAEVARDLDISREAVRKRIKKLEDRHIIQRYVIHIDYGLIGLIKYKILVTLHSTSEEEEVRLIRFCRRHPNIIYVAKTLGPWDYEIDLEVENQSEFRLTLREMKNQFSDIIKDHSSLSIYRIHKYDFHFMGD